MSRRSPARNREWIDLPELGEFLDVLRVRPVPKARQVPVRAGFPGVLGGRLPIHLQDPAARLADHAEDEIDVVHLAC